jgi:DNA-binding NarL/FixJ family response regulator
MVVEDHELVRAAVRQLLDEEADLQVVACCADGLEAVATVADARPDVIVTDLSMPGMDGVETARYVRERHPQVAVVVLTSTPHSPRAAQAVAAGARAVVAKNTDPAQLLAAVRAQASAGEGPD